MIVKNKKDIEEAKLFLNFVSKTKEMILGGDIRVNDEGGIVNGGKGPASNGELSNEMKYIVINPKSKRRFECIYCGSSYVYKRGAISHIERLHNIKLD